MVTAGAALAAGRSEAGWIDQRVVPRRPIVDPPAERALADRFTDLRRHFIFEYYPWYRTNPYRHWNEADRQPPIVQSAPGSTGKARPVFRSALLS